jgi:glycosyltransferase involved in cell wall biosynthesis
MRVALFTGNYNHIADGVSLTLNRAVAYLERHGVAVRVFAPTIARPPLRHAGTLVPVPSIPAPGRPEYRVSLGLPRAARASLRDFAPTLLHVATPDVLGVQARGIALARGVPLVGTYHTHFASYLRYYRLGRLEGAVWRYLRWFYAPFAHVYVPTPSMTVVLREHGMSHNLRLWPRGVDTALFHPARRSLDWRRAIGIADEAVAVAFISRLVAEKGVDVYAAVLARLQACGLPVRGLVVGDGPARAAMQARLPGAVFAGHLEGEALARAYASADVFLFPSDTETFGNVTLEAMASGLPAVCAAATGSDALVSPGETGFLAPPRDAGAFLAHAERLVADPALRRRLGAAARARALAYDWEAVLARLLAYYGEAAGGQRPADG